MVLVSTCIGCSILLLTTCVPSFVKSQVSIVAVVQSLRRVCNPKDCKTPGFLEFAQTHVHGVGGAIRPTLCVSEISSLFSLSRPISTLS